MSASLVRRLTKDGHQCVVYDVNSAAVKKTAGRGVRGTDSIDELMTKLAKPRAVWVMVPAAVAGRTVEDLASHMDGTSGGVFGLERGYCLMIGGEDRVAKHLAPIFKSIAPGVKAAPRTPGKKGAPGPAEHGYLHCGTTGRRPLRQDGPQRHRIRGDGGIRRRPELHHADAGKRARDTDAETTPLRDPEYYQYELDLPEIAEHWRRGTVIGSWLLDLTAAALVNDRDLKEYVGHVSDSGEGRWTIAAAIDEAVPSPGLGAALYERFSSRGDADFANRVLCAMRKQFGGRGEDPLERIVEEAQAMVDASTKVTRVASTA